MAFKSPTIHHHMQMWVLLVYVKSRDIVEPAAAVTARTEHVFHPCSSGRACAIAISGAWEAHDDMRRQVLIAFCVWLAELIVTCLLGPTACHLIKLVIWEHDSLVTLRTLEVNCALARQVVQLIADLSCGTSAASRYYSYDCLRAGHPGHPPALFPDDAVIARLPLKAFDRPADAVIHSIFREAAHQGRRIPDQIPACASRNA